MKSTLVGMRRFFIPIIDERVKILEFLHILASMLQAPTSPLMIKVVSPHDRSSLTKYL